jgi:hypothetical protein
MVFWLVLSGLPVALSSCRSTCEDAVNKTISCAQGEGLKSSLREERELAIKVCSPHADQVKDCLRISDCTEFHRCMKKAVVFREAPPARAPGGEPAMEEPAKDEPDMPAVPE